MKTRMWQEIHEQYHISKTLVEHCMESVQVLYEKIRGKKNLILTGTGASLNACRAAKYAFIQYGGIVPQVMDAYEILYVMEILPTDTLVILVSQSGNSHETRVISQSLKDRNIEFWGITNEPESILAQSAFGNIPMYAGEEISSATKTYSATILILYMLAAYSKPGMLQKIAGLSDDVARTLEMVTPPVEKLVDKLHNCDKAYIAGLGMLGPTAVQGALMMKEKTFICTEGLPISELRHGTVETLKPGIPVLLTATTAPMVQEAVQHASFLTGTGADIYLFADTPMENYIIPSENLILTSNTMEEVFSHITSIIPFQLLAEGIARKNGYDVDGFRYLRKVVDRY